MSRIERASQYPNWFPVVTIGLGFCLAAAETERYTALWQFDVRPIGEFVGIFVFLTIALLLIVRRYESYPAKLTQCQALIIALAIMQTSAVALRTTSQWLPVPQTILSLAGIASQTEFIVFIIYAVFFFGIEIRKSLLAFAYATMIAGFIQIAVTALPSPVGYAAILTLPGLAASMLIVGVKRRQRQKTQSEQEDIAAEAAWGGSFVKGSTFPEYCLLFVAYSVLQIVLHSQGMKLQDGGQGSLAVQAMSGAGGLLTGIALTLLLRWLKDYTLLSALRSIALPLVLAAMYLSLLLADSLFAIYTALLETSFLILHLFVWIVSRAFVEERTGLYRVCVTYLSLRVGWLIGNLSISVSPQYTDIPVGMTVTVIALATVITLSIASSIRSAQDSSQSPTQSTEPNCDPFRNACDIIAKRYNLTPREREVLELLAKGRNARFIANALVISDGTSRTHIMHIYQKMYVNSQQQLMNIVDAALASSSDTTPHFDCKQRR